MKSILCIIPVMAVCTVMGAPAKPDVLFLLGGQSNMKGNGFTPDLPKTEAFAAFRSAPGNVSIWNDKRKRWEPLEIKQRFGPEIGFAYTLAQAQPDRHIGIIKHAVGGTSMDRWATDGELYGQLLGAYRNAQATVPDATLAAMLWHQGERDSGTEADAKAYKGKMVKHIAAIRRDTGEPNLLFMLGQINPAKSFMGRPRFAYAEIVRGAQANLGVEHTLMVPTDDLEKNAYIRGAAATAAKDQVPGQEDNLHYSAKGQIELGIRFAKTYLKTKEVK
ncbi:sialate O-acetylesterase [Pontiella sp.]|uniref:sialate O-acetylesterase n=1 Tax=Pontiella sp. TaxID=2837462 RepID=UPI0035626356